MSCHFQTYIHSKRSLCVTADFDAIHFCDFWRDVIQQQRAIAALKTTQWALWDSHSYDFLVLMFAGVLAGKKLILPPNRIRDLEQEFEAKGIYFLERQAVEADPVAEQVALSNLHLDDGFLASAELLFYTSGSTGAAKEIPRTLKQLFNEVQGLDDSFPQDENTIMLATVSHQHIYGLLFKLLWPLATGRCFYTPQLAFPEDVVVIQAKLHQFGWKNYCISSPALLKRWGSNLSMLHCDGIFSSGGKLDSGVRAYFESRLIEVFGSSETGGIGYRVEDDAEWQVFSNVEIHIDEQQLAVRSAHSYSDCWVLTGDRAEYGQALLAATDEGVGAKRRFKVLGRLDRIVKLEEKRLSLDAIEQTIMGLDEISQCVVMLHRMAHRDYLVCVAVLSKSAQTEFANTGKTALLASLKQQLQHALESIAIPRQWRFLTELPLNSQSKLNRQYLASLFEPMLIPVVLNSHQADADQFTLKLEFAPELEGFKGHFKDYPVYPGVGQVAFVQHFARQTWADLAWCKGLEQVKFQDLIRQGAVLHLHLQRSAHKVNFTIKQDAHIFASGRLSFELNHLATAE